MGQEEMAYNTSNIERKKYDPIYEIWVMVGDKIVKYVGRIQAFPTNINVLTVKGLQLTTAMAKLETTEKLEKLEKEEQVEDSFPVVNVQLIRKLA